MWRQLSVGATFTQLSNSDTTVATGYVPHPLNFDEPRAIDPQTQRFIHRERTAHLQATLVFTIDERLDVTISGGPSHFNLRQGVATNLIVREVDGDPFATVDGDTIQMGEHAGSGWGANVGADVTCMLTPYAGLGFLVRFAAGSVNLPFSGGTISQAVGGVHVGGGLRLRF